MVQDSKAEEVMRVGQGLCGHETVETMETVDHKMRAAWDRVISRELRFPGTYQHVAVLIIRWDDALDMDLRCGAEVSIKA